MKTQEPEGAGETMGLHQVGAGADRCFRSRSLSLSPGRCGVLNDMQLGADEMITPRHLIILKQIRD